MCINQTDVLAATQELVRVLSTCSYSPLAGPAEATAYLGLSDNFDDPRFAYAYAGRNLLRKYPGLPYPVDRARVALDSFLNGEQWCIGTNRRIGGSSGEGGFSSFLDRARSIVTRILGPFSWDQAMRYCDFGPGAAVGCPRARAHAVQKIGISNPTVTGLCVPLLETYRRFDPHVGDLGRSYQVVRGARATTVPKDAKTDRFISIEPLWNMFFQKGIGGMIRRSLKRRGVDLDTSWTINRKLAMEGSIDGLTATIDLSAASDSISTALVERLLPDDWLLAMKLVRSPFTTVDGNDVLLRKFSTMGNGFTFELETLLFLALVLARYPNCAVGLDTIVFGDDIVIPTRAYEPVSEFLAFCGFSVNASKSFWTGKFRESCGMHAFSGQDVTPVYLKKVDSVVDRINYRNALLGLSVRLMGGYGRDSTFRSAISTIDNSLPRYARGTFVPPFSTGIGLWADLDEATPYRWSHQLDAWKSIQLVPQASKRKFEDEPALAYKLWATRREIFLDGESQSRRETPRVQKYRTRAIPVTQWPSMGPWL